MNNILRNVLMRRSTSQFDPRPIRDEELMEILDEAKVLSNAPGGQEWHFTVLQNRPLIRRLNDINERVLEEAHGDILKNPAMGRRMLLDVPVIMIISGRQNALYAEDGANMVFGSMMLVADKYGIGSCWLTSASAIFATEDGRDILEQMSIPSGYAPLCVGAFGYKRAPAVPNVLSSEDNIINIIK